MGRWQEWVYFCDTQNPEQCGPVEKYGYGRFAQRLSDLPPEGWTNDGERWYCPLCSKRRQGSGDGN